MRQIIMTFALSLLMCTTGFAQTEKRIYTTSEKIAAEQARIKSDPELSAKAKADAKALKAIRKKIEAQMDSAAAAKAVNALENLDFVLVADKLVSKYGELAYVSGITNFISLKDDRCTIQIAPYDAGGPNGVGGITLDGRASNIVMSTDKKGVIRYSMMVQGAAVSAVVSVTLPQGTNVATVTVTPNLNSNSISLVGKIVPSKESRVFKGNSI